MQIASVLDQRLSLRRLLPEVEILGGGDVAICRVTADSRRVQPGDLFVALRGSSSDGHDFVPQAIAAGAKAVLVEQPIDAPGATVALTADARAAYGRLCQALAGNPATTVKTIGVTGTNGKTTTSWLIASILNTAGHRCGLVGTLGAFDGVECYETSHTTPPADCLATLLSRMAANDCSHAVLEVSSHALAQSRVAGIQFDAACVTNIRHDHLDFHGTHHAYRQAKSRLLSQLTPEGFAVLNADDDGSASFIGQFDGPALTIGVREPAEISAVLLEQCPSEQTFLLIAGSESIAVRTRMTGLHHVHNCLMAAAVGLAYGIELTTVVRGLEAVQQVPGRLERIECGQPFSVFVDYAHTPDALASVLAALRPVTAGRILCVFGAGGDRDRLKRPAMGGAVEEMADLAIVTTDNPRSEPAGEIVQQILSGFRQPGKVMQIEDRTKAIWWALSQARPGDCVLIAGKGHEKYQLIGGSKLPFDDVEVARHWLYQVQPGAARQSA